MILIGEDGRDDESGVVVVVGAAFVLLFAALFGLPRRIGVIPSLRFLNSSCSTLLCSSSEGANSIRSLLTPPAGPVLLAPWCFASAWAATSAPEF